MENPKYISYDELQEQRIKELETANAKMRPREAYIVSFSFEKAFYDFEEAKDFGRSLSELQGQYKADVVIKTYKFQLDGNSDPMLKKIGEERIGE